MKFPKVWVLVIAIVAIVFFSAKAVFVKLAYLYDIDALPLLLLRMLFALPVYIVIALLKKPRHPEKITSKDYMWILLLGFIGYYLASLTDFLGLEYIKASLERIILFVYPTLVILITWVTFKRPPSGNQVIAIIVSYIGIIITFSAELEISGNAHDIILGAVLVFASALCYASYLVGSGWLIPKFGSTAFTSYAMIVSSICVVIHFLLVEPVNLFSYEAEVYGLAFGMAMVSTVIPSYLVSVSINNLGASQFSIIGSLGPISTIVLANIFLDERLTTIQILGTVIVITAIVVVTQTKKENTTD